MAFTETEFREIVHYLHAHPEAVAELRPLVLSEDVLQLPALVAEIAREVRALAEQQRESTEHADARATELRTEMATLSNELRMEMAALAGELRASVRRFDQHSGSHANTDGALLEARFDRNVGQWLPGLIRKPQRIAPLDIPEVEAAVGRDALSPQELDDLGRVDAIYRGLDPADRSSARFVACEVSATVDTNDVERADRRAALLRRLGLNVAAVSVGTSITGDAESLAKKLGVHVELREP